jgi:Domain of unknown function (DUF4268)
MTTHNLGKLEKVELREAWVTEAGDFTPWLAQPENIQLLGETIGLDDLELAGQEQAVGPFRADIVCHATTDNSLVLIENQLERTDHNHLGQLMTYAAGLQAVTIIWVAARFTDEHRAALDWLNDITDNTFNFFGLEVELWKIGDSSPAPKFNIVSQPNDWSRIVKKGTTGGLTETKLLQLDFWTDFKKYLESNSQIIKSQKPFPAHWMNFAIGRSNFKLIALLDTFNERISVGLILTGPDAKAHYNLLEEEKENIEKELGSSLLWRELPNNKESQILLRFPDNDPLNKDHWPKQHACLCENLENFHKVFSGRVKSLNADDYQPPEENGD